MRNLDTWIVISKHIDPYSLHVKVDDSDFYTAYWVVLSQSKHEAKNLIIRESEGLALGEIAIESLKLYDVNVEYYDKEVSERIRTNIQKLTENEDYELAAWITANAGLW